QIANKIRCHYEKKYLIQHDFPYQPCYLLSLCLCCTYCCP
ncbi:D-alanyl-D-alanine carboxypeptidase domain protein, partial [Vibrio parahaemolyticus V-223/04]